jgi:hypothetical protein
MSTMYQADDPQDDEHAGVATRIGYSAASSYDEDLAILIGASLTTNNYWASDPRAGSE